MKRNLLTLTLLCAISFPIYSCSDSELSTMQCAANARRNNTGGFQGCINQKECGYTGFYLASYSKEGLCEPCEFKTFPNRFVACLLCRRPAKKFGDNQISRCSRDCESGLVEILARYMKVKNPHDYSYVVRGGILAYFMKTEKTERRVCIPSLIENFDHRRPGLYQGARQLEDGSIEHLWSKIIPISTEDKQQQLITTREDAEKHAQAICQKYNVFGPETGTIVKEMPQDVSATLRVNK